MTFGKVRFLNQAAIYPLLISLKHPVWPSQEILWLHLHYVCRNPYSTLPSILLLSTRSHLILLPLALTHAWHLFIVSISYPLSCASTSSIVASLSYYSPARSSRNQTDSAVWSELQAGQFWLEAEWKILWWTTFSYRKKTTRRSIFTVLPCLTLSTPRLTFFWSLHRSSSLTSRRLAAVAHCGARRRMRRFMKLSDSFPAPIWSKSTERSVRKAAWERQGKRRCGRTWTELRMKKKMIDWKNSECFKSSEGNPVVERMAQQCFSLSFSSTLKDLQQPTCLLLLLWQKSMCPPPQINLD